MVIGAGPIGLTVALWARFFGARDVVVSEMAATRAELAQKMGATAVIQPDPTDSAEDLLARYCDAAGGPPDIVFECVGAPGLIQQAIEMAPHGGKVVPVGVCEQPDTFMPLLGLFKELQIQFAIAYNRDDFETCVAMLERMGQRLRMTAADLVEVAPFTHTEWNPEMPQPETTLKAAGQIADQILANLAAAG